MVTLSAVLKPKETAVRGNVVLDGPGNADRVEPFEMELIKDLQALAAHRGNEGLDAFGLEPFQDFIRQVGLCLIGGGCMKGVHPGCLAEDSSGGGVEVLDQFEAQGDQSAIRITIRVQQPFKTVPNADQLPSQFTARQSRTHQHGIHPRDETRPDIDSNSSVIARMAHYLHHRVFPLTLVLMVA